MTVKSWLCSVIQRREEGVTSLVFDDVVGEHVVFWPLVVGQETVQAVGDAVAEDALVILQEQGIVLFVDECRFDKDDWPRRPAQYSEVVLSVALMPWLGRSEETFLIDL